MTTLTRITDTERIMLDFMRAAIGNAAKSYEAVPVTGAARPPVDRPAVRVREVSPRRDGATEAKVDVVVYDSDSDPLDFDPKAVTEDGNRRRVLHRLQQQDSGDLLFLDRDGNHRVWTLPDGSRATRHPLIVRGLSAAIPVVPHDPEGTRYGETLAHRINTGLQSYYSPRVGVTIGTGDGRAVKRTVNAYAGESSLVSVITGAEGVRRTTVATSVHAHSTAMHPDDLTGRMHSVLQGLVGTVDGGLGRVESLRVVGVNPCAPYGQGREVHCEVVFLSRA